MSVAGASRALRPVGAAAPTEQSCTDPLPSLEAPIPKLPQVACFDTAFHRAPRPELADRYAIHRTASTWKACADRVPRLVLRIHRRPILARDACCGRRGRVSSRPSRQRRVDVDHVQRTQHRKHDGLHRSSTGCRDRHAAGRLDPGAVLYLIEQGKLTTKAQVQTLFYHQVRERPFPGLATTCAQSWREVPAPAARLALEYFAYRVGLNAGQLAAALEDLDALVFTAGGIAEDSPSMRAQSWKNSAGSAPYSIFMRTRPCHADGSHPPAASAFTCCPPTRS